MSVKTCFVSMAILIGCLFGNRADAQEALSVTPGSGKAPLNIVAVNKYQVDVPSNTSCTVETTFQPNGGNGAGPAPGEATYTSPNPQAPYTMTLSTNAQLYAGKWVVVAYDEWQTPLINHDAPVFSILTVTVIVSP